MRKKKASDDLIYFSKKWIRPLSLSVEIEDNIRIGLSSSKKNGIKFIFNTESSITPVFESKIYRIDESQYVICFVFSNGLKSSNSAMTTSQMIDTFAFRVLMRF